MFITNNGESTLKKRLNELIAFSGELKFLVGFFYFSGMKELYETLKENNDVVLKILVGLDVENVISQMVLVEKKEMSDTQIIENYFESIKKGFNTKEFDTKDFHEQVVFFLEMMKNDRILIRKTENPNHAKLYFFKVKPEHATLTKSKFIVGSSNLTKSGLEGQEELNVEISDFGTAESEKYFDDLWEKSIKLSENDSIKQRLINTIQMNTLAAEVTPFEAYIIVLKTYLETIYQKDVSISIRELLLKNGYLDYKYQTDAAAQAVSVIENYGGVIIADVVGLGKSIIAGITAKQIGKRGIIICPPGLVGDKAKTTGWKKYTEDFAIPDWEVFSCGKLEEVLEFVRNHDDVETIIIDEAHRFRNKKTFDYDNLLNICRGKKVILLTATPFNNSPADIFALLSLFVVPGKSKITLSNDLEFKFQRFNRTFEKLSYISKYYKSTKDKKREKAETYYLELFREKVVDIKKVRDAAKYLSTEIRNVVEPVLIRRNRLDIKKDPEYSKEVKSMSEVQPPKELFFELSKEQSEFYDKVLNEYFCEDGEFKGAIYTPYRYEQGLGDSDDGDSFDFQVQKNLLDFMRRLLVKRFESCFASFAQSVDNFCKINELALDFIKRSKGRFVLERKLVEGVVEDDEDVEEALTEYAKKLEDLDEKKLAKQKIYVIEKFKAKKEFLEDIENDRVLFEKIAKELKELNLVDNDPKSKSIALKIPEILNSNGKNEPKRKVVIFTEYYDTAKHLKMVLEKEFKERVFTVSGGSPATEMRKILSDFDASSKVSTDSFDILVATDKISEGFNLSRAGAIINYDIPWNPTRVIQRVGRINRIGKKVFDDLFIYNFFPTEKGSDVVKSREIAAAKMFMIHNTLGEDAQIFEADEELKASQLFQKINKNPEDDDEESIQTKIRIEFGKIKKEHPEIIKKIEEFPPMIKTAKGFERNELLVFFRKGLGFFVRGINNEKDEVADLTLEEVLSDIKCSVEENKLHLSKDFWRKYQLIKDVKDEKIKMKERSLQSKACNTLSSIYRTLPDELQAYRPLISSMIIDIQNYRTLSDYTMKVFADRKFNMENEKNRKELKKLLEKLSFELGGEDYIKDIEEKSREIKSDIIIAIENQKNL